MSFVSESDIGCTDTTLDLYMILHISVAVIEISNMNATDTLCNIQLVIIRAADQHQICFTDTQLQIAITKQCGSQGEFTDTQLQIQIIQRAARNSNLSRSAFYDNAGVGVERIKSDLACPSFSVRKFADRESAVSLAAPVEIFTSSNTVSPGSHSFNIALV